MRIFSDILLLLCNDSVSTGSFAVVMILFLRDHLSEYVDPLGDPLSEVRARFYSAGLGLLPAYVELFFDMGFCARMHSLLLDSLRPCLYRT